MIEEKTLGSRLLDVANHLFLFVLAFVCLAPMWHIVAVSLSSRAPSAGGFVTFWPIQFTLSNYQEIFASPAIYKAFFISVQRTAFGTLLSMAFTVLTAYPLSKVEREFPGRNVITWVVVFAMLFSGGLIPWFLVIRKLKLLNTLWALVLPNAVPIWNVILMMNFFKTISPEIEEAAVIDGATHWGVLGRIFRSRCRRWLRSRSLPPSGTGTRGSTG